MQKRDVTREEAGLANLVAQRNESGSIEGAKVDEEKMSATDVGRELQSVGGIKKTGFSHPSVVS